MDQNFTKTNRIPFSAKDVLIEQQDDLLILSINNLDIPRHLGVVLEVVADVNIDQ